MTFTRVFTIDTGEVSKISRKRIFLEACRQNPRIEQRQAKEQETNQLLNTVGAYNQMSIEGCDCDGFYGSERFVVLSDFLGIRFVRKAVGSYRKE